MSKIDDLIKQYCPNGVEYKRIDELCIVKTGGDTPKNCIKGQLYPSEEYPYPVYSNGTETYGYADSYRIDRDAVSISSIGNVGYVAYRAAYFTPIIRLKVLLPNTDILTTKFLFYALTAITFVGTNSSLSSMKADDVKKYKIPVPPLPVQEEIVRILDAFSSLEAELEAELEARKKQYEYYRNKLLTFNENTTGGGRIKFMQLGEVCNKVSTIKWKNNQDKEYKYIDLSSLNRNNNTIEDAMVITNDNAPSRAQQIVKKDDVLFGTTRPTLRRYCIIPNEYDNQICSTGYCVLRADTNIIIPQYLFFMLTTNSFYNYVEEKQSGASYPSISDTLIKKYIIPVPPLEEQERIVAILDKFDSLVNDISEGLPAELTARRQQYEYYRNKLLTFDEAA